MILFRHLLGTILRQLRTSQHLRLADVSGLACISTGYLSEVERGKREASSEVLEAIFSALAVPPSDVFRAIADGFDGTISSDGVTFSGANECLVCDL